MPNSNYFLFPVSAGDIKFTTGNHIVAQSEAAWSVKSGEATIKVKPGYVYYLKLKVVPMGGWASYLDNMPHQEGASLIESYKLIQIKR